MAVPLTRVYPSDLSDMSFRISHIKQKSRNYPVDFILGVIMNTFADAVVNQESRTENGMKSRQFTADACVDLFFKAGAMRGQDIIPAFTAAFVEDKNLTLRIVQWLRDVRDGAGERQSFRNILKHLEKTDPNTAASLLHKVPELGRWDDLLVLEHITLKTAAYSMIKNALEAGNGLCAKWMPRKGALANELRNSFGWTPKFYRKRLVELTKVVETQMCAKDWDNINFSHVPSVAAARYKKAFKRNTDKYAEYVEALVKGDNPKVKVNASAIFPYDVLKDAGSYRSETERNLIIKQWEALPNYVGDANILPLVDVSGSMTCPAGQKGSVTCLDVALSLGLYLADKNIGKFKDTFLTFSHNPELMRLKGNVIEKMDQMNRSNWEMNTDLNAAMVKILATALAGNVPQEEMPSILLILSDMQFDQCARYDDTAMQMIRRKFEEAGYKVPQIVFWNLNARDNVPVKYNEKGAALVSGFSPSIVKAVLAADMEDFTPYSIMMKTISNPKYDL